jgi:hypothetical protein
VRVGSMRGVKPKTHRARPVVTQGQTGHPRADSTAPNPERRCGCGTRLDLRDSVGANDRFFSRSRLPEAKAAREPLLTLRPLTHVRPQAEPTRGTEPPPGHSQPVPRPIPCVPQRHRTGRAICLLPLGVTVRIRQRMLFCIERGMVHAETQRKKERRRVDQSACGAAASNFLLFPASPLSSPRLCVKQENAGPAKN